MSKTIKVTGCGDCPFVSAHGTGGKSRRLHVECNLQDTGSIWNAKGIYSHFDTCPLKEKSIKVQLT
jgi:hypothetical protein